jgi:hypothetical protein
MTQDARPDPPVLSVPRLDASVHWKALLFGRLVADFRVETPYVYVDRKQAEAEAEDPTPLGAHGWQAAVQAIYPLKINELEIVNGDVTYVEEGPFAPLRLRQVNVTAENIRNVRSQAGQYPSPVRIDAVVFDAGMVSIEGHGDFRAEPHVALRAAITLDKIDLGYFRPITDRFHVSLRRGAVSARGLVEYTPSVKVVDLEHAVVSDAVVDYVHVPQTVGKVGQAAVATVATARETANAPDLLVRARQIDVVNANVGVVNRTARPAFRLFLENAQLHLENFSNRRTDGTAVARLQGRFMGNGKTVAVATFRPETSGPDFDVDIKIENTDMRTMNDLLRAYGKFDVAAGWFSLYSQFAVKNNRVVGYVKPLFSDVRAYDPAQDRDKGFLRRLYERVVGAVTKILKNAPRDEVATVIDISGPLPDPQASTLQAIGNLVRNAFFKAILPGFDRDTRAPSR